MAISGEETTKVGEDLSRRDMIGPNFRERAASAGCGRIPIMCWFSIMGKENGPKGSFLFLLLTKKLHAPTNARRTIASLLSQIPKMASRME